MGEATHSLTTSGLGLLALAIFVIAYALVLAEDVTELRKSKPVVFAGGLIWICVALAYQRAGLPHADEALRETLLEYAQLFLFLLAAMTYVNTMDERNVFASLRARLVSGGYSYRTTYWLLGAMAFVLSPILDNLTTALIAGAVTVAIGRDERKFVVPCCVSVVVAANAGGAFSPFGDISTLMVWQQGKVAFLDFLPLFWPSLVNWLIPAAIMVWAVPKGRPAQGAEPEELKSGAFWVIALFAATIAMTVTLHQLLHLPPFIGMMTGLGALKILGHFIRREDLRKFQPPDIVLPTPPGLKPAVRPFDIFISTKRVEWDTLLFFFGVMFCVGGLGALGYLQLLSVASYQNLGATETNILVGIASAIIDNIPVMFSVLSINPDMSQGQWLLVTLTAGVGGSLLSVGSAAGVALMGQARGVYTFMAHFKWCWAIALGYAASIALHLWLNARLFS